MLFIYIRHGEPIYEPDSLTEFGKLQAEAIAKHFSKNRLDRIFSSTSNRAIQTAIPTAKILNKDITYVDFANEKHTWEAFTIPTNSVRRWIYQTKTIIDLFHSNEITELGFNWYKHPNLSYLSLDKEMNRIQKESTCFFEELGYQYVGDGKYKVVKDNNDHVAMFAHEGFGLAFLSLLIHMPYPLFCTRFHLGHAQFTFIEFKNEDGYAYPKVISLSNNLHLSELTSMKKEV